MSETKWFTWKTINRKCDDVDALIHSHISGFEQSYDVPAIRADVIAELNKWGAYDNCRTDGEAFYGPSDTSENDKLETVQRVFTCLGIARIIARHQKV